MKDMVLEILGKAESTIDFFIDNGIWMAIGTDVFLATGRVSPDDKILYAQRDGLVKLLDFFLDDKFKIGLPLGLEASVPNPLGAFNRFIQPIADELRKREQDQPDPESLKRIEEEEKLFLEELKNLDFEGWKPGTIFEELTGLQAQKKTSGWKKGTYIGLPLGWRIFTALFVVGILKGISQITTNLVANYT